MKNTLTLAILLAILSISITHQSLAEIKLPAIVSSDMVLQRNTTVQLWGWAAAKEKISITTSWLDQSIEVVADKDGNWQIEVKTTASKSPQTIKLKSAASTINLDNILFGEVWLCSGQSNMEMPIKGFSGQPTFGGHGATVNGANADLRLFTVERNGAKVPQNDLDKFKAWQQATPESVADFSAVAYFFGQQLQEILDVPVGLIHTSWGGSTVQAWMSVESIAPYQAVDLDDEDLAKRANRIPTALFNGMINPLVPFTIKGAIWYQGESNRNEPELYKKLFPAMVEDWRARWQSDVFPFYFVQIAPFAYGDKRDEFQSVGNSAFIREAQLQCVELITNSGIAITMDIGDPTSIHPPKKKEVADRLLYNALNKTYGYSAVDGDAPVFESLVNQENGLVLSFGHADTGLYAFGELTGFEIAGADKVFYPAKAEIIQRKKVLVSSDQVKAPVAVRYAWSNWIEATLFDTNLLPASSFRTDDWEDAVRADQ